MITTHADSLLHGFNSEVFSNSEADMQVACDDRARAAADDRFPILRIMP
jgi:hypothetical protein